MTWKRRTCHNCGGQAEPLPRNECYLTTGQKDTCNDCWDYFGEENSHSDGGHDQILEWLAALTGVNATSMDTPTWMQEELPFMAGCRICKGDSPGKKGPAETEGPQETRGTKGWTSHTGHLHPMTNTGRAACRRAQRKAAEGVG